MRQNFEKNRNIVGIEVKKEMKNGKMELSNEEAQKILEKLKSSKDKDEINELENKLILQLHYFIVFKTKQVFESDKAKFVLYQQGFDKNELEKDLVDEGTNILLQSYKDWQNEKGTFVSFFSKCLENNLSNFFNKFLTKKRMGKTESLSYHGDRNAGGYNIDGDDSLDNRGADLRYKKQSEPIDPATENYEEDMINSIQVKKNAEKITNLIVLNMAVPPFRLIIMGMYYGLGEKFIKAVCQAYSDGFYSDEYERLKKILKKIDFNKEYSKTELGKLFGVDDDRVMFLIKKTLRRIWRDLPYKLKTHR